MDTIIYLDHNATTPCDPRVIEAMLPYFGECYANPTSRSHRPGRDAFMALETARETVARCLGCRSNKEIVFTSGATEANNTAILGTARAHAGKGRHLLTQATEHSSVLEPLRALAATGWELEVLGVDEHGRVRLDELKAALRDDTVLLSLMMANNETGTIQPLREAVEMAHAGGVPVLCDAAQGVGKLPVDVRDLEIDMLTLSGHKFYGPKGIGAIFVARGTVAQQPIIFGGGQEGGLRSGTVNLPAAVGLARALEIAIADGAAEAAGLQALRDRFESQVCERLDGCSVNGDTRNRLAGTSNISIAGIDGEALLASLPDLAVSTGSACTSSTPEPSAVLRAMGVPRKLAASSLRISVGRFSTREEVDSAAHRIIEESLRLRKLGRRRRR